MSETEWDTKPFPAATHEDQEAIMAGELGEPTVLGTVPFSSPEPHTDGLRMLPLEDGTSAHQASLEAAAGRDAATTGDYDSMKAPELKALVADRGLEADGNKKADYIAALQADDASDMKASDFIAQINEAEDQEALDAVAALYEAQDRELVSVEAAFERKQTELNEEQ